jgi:hypothetical protein
MLFAVICSYIRWEGEPTLHVIVGSVCAMLFAIHFYLNRKIFAAFGKGMKKLNISKKTKYLIDWLLIIIWSVAIISGLLALLSYLGIIEAMLNFRRFHGIFCRVGGGLLIIHIIQHGKQIISYIKRVYRKRETHDTRYGAKR